METKKYKRLPCGDSAYETVDRTRYFVFLYILATLWIADKVIIAIGEGKELAGKALKIVQKEMSVSRTVKTRE